MLKRIMKLSLLFTALFTLLLNINLTAHASENYVKTQVVIHHRISQTGNISIINDGKEDDNDDGTVPGANTVFNVYDLSSLYNEYLNNNRVVGNLFQKIGSSTPTQIQSFIKKNNITKLFSTTTNNNGEASFFVNGSKYHAYLIVQSNTNLAKSAQSFAMPIAIGLPFIDSSTGLAMTTIHIYTKAAELEQAPYFFKYGRDHCGNKFPLKNAEFVFYREINRHKQYLTTSNNWISSTNPKGDQQVLKIFSKKDGLVFLRKYNLLPGRYFFQEVTAPKGFEISNYARHIPVLVPKGYDKFGFNKNILVNNTSLPPLTNKQVPLSAYNMQSLGIFNCQKQTHNNTHNKKPVKNDFTRGGDNHSNSKFHFKNPLKSLPQTGEEKLSAFLIGVVLIALGVIIYIYDIKGRNKK